MVDLFGIVRSVQQASQNIPLVVDTVKGVTGGSSGNGGGGGFGGFSGEQSNNNSMLTTQQTLQNAENQLLSVGLSSEYMSDALKLYLESKFIKNPNDLLVIGNGNSDVFITNQKTDTKITSEMLRDFDSFINAKNTSTGFKMSDAIKETYDSRIAMEKQYTTESIVAPTVGGGTTQYKGRQYSP